MKHLRLFVAFALSTTAFASVVSIHRSDTSLNSVDKRFVREVSEPTRFKMGKWRMAVKGLPDKTIDLEFVETPSCGFGFAAFYSVGTEKGVLPGSAKHGSANFQMVMNGKIHDVYIAPEGEKLVGSIKAFDESYESTLEATFVSAENGFEVVPVAASMNGVPFEHVSESGEKTWYVRSPGLNDTKGDVVFHRNTDKYFTCYGLDNEGSFKQAFSYSDHPVFITVASDLNPASAYATWVMHNGTGMRLQRTPRFILSVFDQGHSIDLVGRN